MVLDGELDGELDARCKAVDGLFGLCSGPGVEGLAPAEACDRLQSFQAQFDELWRKYVTYSGGEELFGLTVTGETLTLTDVKHDSGQLHHRSKLRPYSTGLTKLTELSLLLSPCRVL